MSGLHSDSRFRLCKDSDDVHSQRRSQKKLGGERSEVQSRDHTSCPFPVHNASFTGQQI